MSLSEKDILELQTELGNSIVQLSKIPKEQEKETEKARIALVNEFAPILGKLGFHFSPYHEPACTATVCFYTIEKINGHKTLKIGFSKRRGEKNTYGLGKYCFLGGHSESVELLSKPVGHTQLLAVDLLREILEECSQEHIEKIKEIVTLKRLKTDRKDRGIIIPTYMIRTGCFNGVNLSNQYSMQLSLEESSLFKGEGSVEQGPLKMVKAYVKPGTEGQDENGVLTGEVFFDICPNKQAFPVQQKMALIYVHAGLLKQNLIDPPFE